MSGAIHRPLTAERLFSDPPLLGAPPADASFSPDGRYVVYRAQARDDRERFDLYRHDIEAGVTEHWIDARSVTATSTDVTALTAAERAERERRRDFSHGIRTYAWRPGSNDLLLPMDGEAYLKADGEAPRRITPLDTRQSAFQWSPRGRFISYVRDGDLFAFDLRTGAEARLTDDASATVSNGLPDFLAAEEMHRFEGHWWHPEERGLFYCRVDESPVPVSHRLELDANGARTIPQRYPYAGGTNPIVELWFAAIDASEDAPARRLWRSDGDRYLARVYVNDAYAIILTQDRRQQALSYEAQALGELTENGWRTLFEETSSTWVNLTDDFVTLPDGSLVISDELDGQRQLRRLNMDGASQRMPSPAHVSGLLGAREGRILATGWQDSPLENHLFALDDERCVQVTSTPGWHDIRLAREGLAFLDRLTTTELPASLSIASIETGTRTTIYADAIEGDHPYAAYLAHHSRPDYGTVVAEDGQTLHYRLTPPADRRDGETYPVIVYVYGGPGAQKARRDFGSLLLQLFAQQGFGVFELDNRGSANRGRDFEAPIYRAMGTVEVTDQFAGVAALRDLDWVDDNRIGVFGHSYGGYMSLLCLSHPTTPFAAGVAVAPVCDWSLYDSHYTERFMDTPENNPEGYAEGNVLNRLDSLDRPLLLMHGMADDNVLFTHTTLIMGSLQTRNKKFELMTYPGAKHSMQERHVSIHRFEYILDFFKRTLAR